MNTSITWDEAIRDYCAWLAAARRSPETIRLYKHYARQLAATMNRPSDATPRSLERFVGRYARKSAAAQKSARQVTRGFYRWAASHDVVDADPSVGLPSVREDTKVPRPMPEQLTIAALRSASRRERHMVLLGRYGGLRIGEIARVHSSDWLHPKLLVHGKGAKEREVPIVHPELVDVLDHLDGWMFATRDGGHLLAPTIGTYLGDLFPPGWSAHKLRTAFATEAYRRNPDLIALAKVMGHAKTETTLRYVRLHDDALLRVVEAAYGDGPGHAADYRPAGVRRAA